MGAEKLLKGKFGLFTHYLYGDENWVTTTNNLDIPKLAAEIASTGATHYFITLMQKTKYMLAPNDTYDRIAGTKPGEACAIRDVPLELGLELKKYGIDLYLYYTGDGPYGTPEIGRKFGFVERANNMNMPFVEKWSSVLREYSVRYGDLVKGWWIDGCYIDYFGYTPDMIDKYYEACKAGNPDCIVCTNQGVSKTDQLNISGKHEEYTCGEENDFIKIPESQFVGKAQTHILAPLGIAPDGKPYNAWAQHGVKRNAEYLANYIKKLNKVPCALTIDVWISRDGSLDPEQAETLRKVSELLENNILP